MPETYTGSQGGEKFVARFEKAITEYSILNKAMQGEVTKENLQQTFRGNLQPLNGHFQPAIQKLVQEGHLKEQNNKYTITDDGREDVQKVQSIVAEVMNVSGNQPKSGPQTTGQKQGVPQNR